MSRLFGVVGVLAVAVATLFVALPIVALFTQVPPGDVPKLLKDPVVTDALVVTLRTTLVANAITLAVGTPAAYLLANRSFRGRAAVVTVLELPLVLPPAVAGIALLAAFGAMGLLGGELAGAGIVLPFTEWAVVVAIVFVASPFYLRQAIAAFESVPRTLTDTARTLGASPARTFWRIALPLAAGGLVAGWVLSFARGLGEFGATIVFAGSVGGETQTLTLAVYDRLEGDFDVALALGILLVVVALVVLLAYKAVVWKRSASTSASLVAPSS